MKCVATGSHAADARQVPATYQLFVHTQGHIFLRAVYQQSAQVAMLHELEDAEPRLLLEGNT
jgi:hypothetical protein